MKDMPVAVMLAPLLFAQGRYVRKRTPILPEASGTRTGSQGAGTKLSLMILGDSAAAGVGVASQEQALCGQLVSRLERHYHVGWELIAKTGATTADVLSWIPTIEKHARDVVVVSLGVNDVTGGVTRKTWLRQQRVLVQELATRFAPRHIVLTQVPPMDSFLALPHPLRWVVGQQSRRFNLVAKSTWHQHDICEFLEPAFTLDPPFLASDRFHPGALAYEAWAESVAQRVLDRFSPSPV